MLVSATHNNIMRPSEKKIKVQMRLLSKDGSRGKDAIMSVVKKLARYMRYRLSKLTSLKEPKQMMTRTMYIKFKHKPYHSRLGNLRSRTKLRVPMDIDKKVAPFLHYWHEPTWNMFLLRLAVACSRVDTGTLLRTQLVALEATDFMRCHIRRTEKKYDAKYIQEVMSEFSRACGEEFDPYLPVSEEQLKLLAGHSVRPKYDEQQKNTSGTSILPGNILKRNLRQTRIDEYFHPRRVKRSCYEDNRTQNPDACPKLDFHASDNKPRH